MQRILFLEDDPELREGLVLAFAQDPYDFVVADRLAKAEALLEASSFDLLLLDLNLPDGHAYALLRRWRTRLSCPILILTALDMEIDQVRGLELGADDYLCKPFSLAVLRAKIRAQLRKQERLDTGNFSFRPEGVFFKGTPLDLSKTESKLLFRLAMAKGEIVTRSDLSNFLWPSKSEYIDENGLSVHLKRLRVKGKRYGLPAIRTLYGRGVLMEEV